MWASATFKNARAIIEFECPRKIAQLITRRVPIEELVSVELRKIAGLIYWAREKVSFVPKYSHYMSADIHITFIKYVRGINPEKMITLKNAHGLAGQFMTSSTHSWNYSVLY